MGEAALVAYQAYQQTMRQFLALQEQVMKQFLSSTQPNQILPSGNVTVAPQHSFSNGKHNGNGAAPTTRYQAQPGNEIGEVLPPPAPEAPSVPPSPPASPAPEALLPDRASLTQTLLQLVSDRTGYPMEMLGLDQDIEAELGIDSIKRVEIFGALLKILPENLSARVQERIESFTEVKTLSGIVEQLLQSLRSSAPSASPNTANREEDRLGKSPDGVETIPRYVMQARTEPLPSRESIALTGLFLITEDQLSVAPYVAQALQQGGASTAIIASSVLLEPEKIAREIAELRQKYGSVSGIVHLAPLAVAPTLEKLSDWRKYTQIQSKSLFQMLQLCAEELQQAGQQQKSRVLAASLLGGYFGRDGCYGSGLPTGGSCNGLLKALAIEWSNVCAKAIDFDNSLSPADMAQQIIDELLCVGGRLEVGYSQGKRQIFDTVAAPLKTGVVQIEPNADWIVLLTGGARGITAEIANQLVIPGMTMVVVGRSPEPTQEPSEFNGIEDIAALRRVLLDRAKVQGLSATPVQIENKVQELLRDRSIRRNLENLKTAGARVEYWSVDVRSDREFGGLIDDIYSRYGRLDAVIHGAGIIEDKLIVNKSAASFDRVFDTKVDSTFILSRHLRPESLKLLVLFGSVAGRYGNRGQSDYAAANEVINRLAWQMDELWSNTRVVTINWGPWDTTGMASEEVKRQLKNQGIIPINLQAGCQFFVDELRYGRKGETEIVAGEGLWANYEQRS
ncbi:MAG TPA: hypothetical protein DEV81_08655 [Cyanobacteria bacterium UBA11049]|nr:hypothetical protein [Cyanobacteria bacterium UBA11049]